MSPVRKEKKKRQNIIMNASIIYLFIHRVIIAKILFHDNKYYSSKIPTIIRLVILITTLIRIIAKTK